MQQNTSNIFNQPVDQQALALTHAIALQESGKGGQPNYSAVGDNGTSHGAYQWQPGNFESAAKEAGLDPNDKSPENQDKVAYAQVLKYKNQGYDPGQIASLWNSGSPNNYQNHSGTTIINGKSISYDTPKYVQGVQKYYNQIIGSNGSSNGPVSVPDAPEAPTPINISNQQQPQDQNTSPSLGQNLEGRLQDASTGLQSIIGGESGTNQSRLSGLLQVGGAAAGALGDVINKGLELIPGVKQVEGLIGQGAGALAKTSAGQSVANAIQSFSTAHPELSKDIGAGFNLVTAIPIVDGLGAAGNIVKDAASSALQGVAEKSVQNGLESTIGKAGLKGGMFLSDNPTIAADMVEERALPKVVGGKYDSLPAIQGSQTRISQFGNQVQTALNDAKYASPIGDSNQIVDKAVSAFPNSDFTNEDMINNAKGLTPQNSKLWTKFANGEATIKEVNLLRSDLDKAVKSVYTSTIEPPIKKEMGASMAGAMRQYVQSNAPETQQLFANMAKEYRIQKALGYLHKKTVTTGLIGAGEIASATVGGEALGAAHGMPLVGGFIGRQIGGGVAKRLAGIPEAILERTGKGAIKSSLSAATKSVARGAVGALAQKAI